MTKRKEKEVVPYKCPRCGAESWNPNDIEQRYCGRCHVFEDDAQGPASKAKRFVELSSELEEAIECVLGGMGGMEISAKQKAVLSAYAAPLANVLASNELALPGVIEMLKAAAAERKEEGTVVSEHSPIFAVAGVIYDGERTLYFKRSEQMENYPGVWSLLSIQFAPHELPDHLDHARAQPLFERMAAERLNHAPIVVKRYLTSGVCSDNPMGRRVELHLYEVDALLGLKNLNPRFYTGAAWLRPEEYQERTAGAACGLCLRLWSDYAVRNGLARERFAPALAEGAEA